MHCGKGLIASDNGAEESSGSQDHASGSVTKDEISQGKTDAFSKDHAPHYQLLSKKFLVPVIAGACVFAIAGGAAFALINSNGDKPAAPQTSNSLSAVTTSSTSSTSPVFTNSTPITTASSPNPSHDSFPIEISDELRAQPGAGGVVATLGTYFWGVNSRSWQTVWQQFTAAGQQRVGGVEKLAQDDATSNDFKVAVHDITPVDAATLQVFVTFTSTQDPGYGPNGETCDNWTLDYTFKRENGSWLIDVSRPHNGISYQSCNGSANNALPARVGQCSITTITNIGTRLTSGGVPVPNSGITIMYANGGYQVSYDLSPSVSDWRVGDQVQLCLVSLPSNCPPGDDRGKLYKATNLRTNESWQAYDSEHSCGGA
ncbi:MAG: hypothetical protein M1340_08355 [Actinobacteria bacterium]|nr:hypothetical protein [Actinomycetota bacterium]MCL6093821.1 hypothetical protein [Actinomycetota bacterium]